MTRLTAAELEQVAEALDEAGHPDLVDKIYAHHAESEGQPGRVGARRSASYPVEARTGLPDVGVGAALARGFREAC